MLFPWLIVELGELTKWHQGLLTVPEFFRVEKFTISLVTFLVAHVKTVVELCAYLLRTWFSRSVEYLVFDFLDKLASICRLDTFQKTHQKISRALGVYKILCRSERGADKL